MYRLMHATFTAMFTTKQSNSIPKLNFSVDSVYFEMWYSLSNYGEGNIYRLAEITESFTETGGDIREK